MKQRKRLLLVFASSLLLVAPVSEGLYPDSRSDSIGVRSREAFLSELGASAAYALVFFDMQAILRDVARGHIAFETPLLGSMTLGIEPRDLRAATIVAEHFDEEGRLVRDDVPFARTYRGWLVNENGEAAAGTGARLRITENGVSGYVQTPRGTLNLDPLPGGLGPNREHVAYLTESVVMPRTHGPGTGRPPNSPRAPLFGPDAPTGTIRFTLGASEGYVDNAGGWAQARDSMLSTLNEIEGTYALTMGWSLEAVHLAEIPESAFACQSAWEVREGYRAYMNARASNDTYPEWNQGTLFYGGDLHESCNPGLLDASFGLASYDGFAHEESYAVAQTTSEWTNGYFASTNAVHRRSVLTHEGGHVQGGDHCKAIFDAMAGTKTVMASWAKLDPGERQEDPGCADVPPDWPALGDDIYEYSVVERFSDSPTTGNDNKREIDTLVGDALTLPSTPPAPVGPASAEPLETVAFTFDLPDTPCNATPGTYHYIEIDWGDGVPLRPPVGEHVCDEVTRTHSWSDVGPFNVKYRIKRWWLGPWSPWSTTPITLACVTDDLGPLCDAPSEIGSAVRVPRGDTPGFIRNGDQGDFYKFKVSGGSDIKVRLTVPSCEDYNLELYRPDGTRVDTSYQPGCTVEEVTAENIVQYGDWSVFVFGVGGSHSMDAYTLNVFAGNVIRDDDGIRDTSYVMDAYNDKAEKRLVLPSNALSGERPTR